jgi:uncharacterized protein
MRPGSGSNPIWTSYLATGCEQRPENGPVHGYFINGELMPQFLILAYDDTRAGTPEWRKAARPSHLEGLRPLVDSGQLVAGGPILDDEERVVGTVAVMDVESRAAIDAWLEREPYAVQGVWDSIEVRPMRLVVRDGKIIP